MGKAMLRGAIGFGLVSVAAFSVWAFPGKWLTETIGEKGMYGAVAAAFLVLTGVALHPLAKGPVRFYAAFVPAFAAYAVVWSALWFALHSRAGEWLGSAAGTAAFAVVAGLILRGARSIPKAAAVLFVTHSIGYFLGGLVYYWSKDPATHASWSGVSAGTLHAFGRLGWGLLYGLGFGAGLGYAFSAFQSGQAKEAA